MNLKLMILLNHHADLDATKEGIELLKTAGVPFTLRLASAHLSPELVGNLVHDFEGKGGQAIIAVAGMSAHLAGMVAAVTCLPVIAVPTARSETFGLDALLSVSQMSQGVPVATMGFGASGFMNAVLLATQIFALNDESLGAWLKEYKSELARSTRKADEAYRIDYKGHNAH